MNQYREQTVTLLLRECRRLFEENFRKCTGYPEEYGRFPERAAVIMSDRIEGGAQLAGWLITIDSEVTLELPVELPRNRQRSEMFYGEGSFVFCLSESGTTAQIDMILGPRYGRGYEYTVSCPYGKPKLTDQKTLWVS